jgi:hypothetical protein
MLSGTPSKKEKMALEARSLSGKFFPKESEDALIGVQKTLRCLD